MKSLRFVGLAKMVMLVAQVASAQVAGEIEHLDPPLRGFFSKRLVVHGTPILAHCVVDTAALDEAARRIDRLLNRAPGIVANLNALNVTLQIIGRDQAVTDLPQYRHMKGRPFEGHQTMDERGRGYGGIECSCSEENLLSLPSDRYRDHRDICSHEFAHSIFGFGLTPEIRGRVEAQWRRAIDAGKWKGMYAATNADEYFAELTMWYVGSRGDYGKLDPPPSPGARWLRSYDSEGYQLLDDVYSGRLAPGRITVTDLQPLPASAEGQIKSSSGPITQIIFENRTDKPIHLYWLDFKGARAERGTVAPGTTRCDCTYASHAWFVQYEDGVFIGIYVAERTVNRIIIGGVKKPKEAVGTRCSLRPECPFEFLRSCRCDHDLADQFQGAGIMAGRDGAHIPDHPALGIEVGSSDQQQAALAVFLGNGVQQFLIDLAVEHLPQRTVVRQRIVEKSRQQVTLDQNVFFAGLSVHLAERLVVLTRSRRRRMIGRQGGGVWPMA
jgi:hypothetical protein